MTTIYVYFTAYSCRNACLKLHEDSTLILKQEFFAEKEKTESQYKNEINRLRYGGYNNYNS